MRPLLAVALVLVAVAPADADPQHGKKKPPADPAEAAYQDGRRHYDLREWDDAIASFKESYRLRTDERSLFNIAQAYRLKGDCVDALGFYQTYKRNFPDAEGIPAVDKLIVDIEPCVREKTPPPVKPTKPGKTPGPAEPTDTTTTTEPALGAPAKTPPSPPPPPPAGSPGHGKRVAGITVASVGLVAIAGGVFFGLQAQSKAQDVEGGRGTFDPQLQADGQAADRNAKILFIGGGALVATGVIVYLLGRSHSEVEHVAVVPVSGGGVLAWRASF